MRRLNPRRRTILQNGHGHKKAERIVDAFLHLTTPILLLLSACSTPSMPYEGSPLQLSEAKWALSDTRVALLEPIVPDSHCQGDAVLLALPDEIVCKVGSEWVFHPSSVILPPSNSLLVSLRYAGLSTSVVRSLAQGVQDGAHVAVLLVLRRVEARMSDSLESDTADSKVFKVTATVALTVLITELRTGRVLWHGPLEESVENRVPTPPLQQSAAALEAGAGIGQFEPQMYAVRALVVQAYAQLGQALARQIEKSASRLL